MTVLASATASGFAYAPLWYTTRATAIIAFIVMTVSFALGIAATQRALASRAWPRFATQQLHRNVALVGVVALLTHIVTTLADSYVHVGWLSFVVPGISGYRTLWVALGTIAFDVFLVVTITSLLRHRLSARLWRTTHWLVYAAWPLAFLHFLKTGTDAAHHRWGLWLAFASLAFVVAAVITRLRTRNQAIAPLRSVAGAGATR
jgi:sulfoxide reductase heme-binding subunit YedZ